MNNSSDVEFSLLLWVLCFGAAMLAAQLSQAWARLAHARGGPLRRQWPALLVAAAVLGTGLCSAMVLGMCAEALPFPIGYHWGAAAGLWLAAMVASLPVVAITAGPTRGWTLLAAGALLALVAGAVQAGWIGAAGFRPGAVWRPEWVAVAAAVQVSGLSTALWVSHSQTGHHSPRRTLWRIGGAALVAVVLTGGQALLMWAAGMHGQQGSVYQNELPGTVLCPVSGVLVTLVMAGMLLDMQLRRQHRGHKGARALNLLKRRKRRHRVRHL